MGTDSGNEIKWFVYLLQSSIDKKKIYIGKTNNLERRLKQHNGNGGAKYTKNYRPWQIACYVGGFQEEQAALQFEWAIQHPGISRHFKNIEICRSRTYKARSNLVKTLLKLEGFTHLHLTECVV